jgi:putative heme-binding domain-containing protein
MFPRLRAMLANSSTDLAARKHAYFVLSRASDAASVPIFVSLLDDDTFRTGTINLLSRFNIPGIPQAILGRFQKFSPADRSAALNTLTSRATFALPLLDAVASGKIPRNALTAYHIRALTELHDPTIDARVVANWGRIQQTRSEMRDKIERLDKTFKEAPLWAYDARAGKEYFLKLCSVCHRIGNDGVRLGPELTGAGKNGIRYFLENIIDPDAVIGADFRMTTIETRDGDVTSGIIAAETPGAITLRTPAGERVLPTADILKRTTSEKSLMPEGLLESLNEREQIELLKFLTNN